MDVKRCFLIEVRKNQHLREILGPINNINRVNSELNIGTANWLNWNKKMTNRFAMLRRCVDEDKVTLIIGYLA